MPHLPRAAAEEEEVLKLAHILRKLFPGYNILFRAGLTLHDFARLLKSLATVRMTFLVSHCLFFNTIQYIFVSIFRAVIRNSNPRAASANSPSSGRSFAVRNFPYGKTKPKKCFI